MAAGSSPSDQSASLLKKLSLKPQTDTVEVPAPSQQGFYGDNGAFTPQQDYGYASFGAYNHQNSVASLTPGQDCQLNGTEQYQYQYPGQLYQPLASTAGNPSGSGFSNTGSLNKPYGPKPYRPRNNSSSTNLNGSYSWGGLQSGYYSSAYQDPRYSFDGFQSPIPWLDVSQFSDGTPRYATNTGFSSQQNSHHARPSSSFGQAPGYVNMMYPSSRMYSQYGNRGGAYNSWTNGRGWVVVDNKYKPRGRGYANENMDGLSELNKGPRGNSLKNQKDFVTHMRSSEEQNPSLTDKDKNDALHQMVDKEQFNEDDFPEDYAVAKFFVIKSYSEDDVHRSIKYNVWTSTPNGNKKLDATYQEAEKNAEHCPVFLLFSVNTSGQFVGLAEMVGPVDFNKTVEYWQQDKWNGCFPVKWHIIKDVPNGCLRHITLVNNENKPVTNSRDTQEVSLEKGVEIIKILKGYKNKTSILDDFEFYAHRERIMQEKRAKQNIQKQVSEVKSGNSVTDGKEKVPESNKENSQEPMTNGHAKPSEDNKLDGPQSENSLKESEKVVPNVVGSAC